MEEIKLRTEIIGNTLSGTYGVPQRPAFELGCLQLRMICELIALACLAVHGDNPAARTARMRSAYAADFILKALGKLHPRFFPEPGLTLDHPDGGRHFVATSRGHMTKDELITLYWHCGEQLHRGSFNTILNLAAEMDFDAIIRPTVKITGLLNFHRIAFIESEDELWVSMKHPESGKVRASLVRSV